MKKKIFQLILVLMFAMPAVMMAQTVEIDSVTQPPGDILVQVDMLGFTGGNGNVAAITLTIEYDSDLMSFVSIENTNASFTGSWQANYSNNQLIITYLLLTGTGHDIDGKLLDIKFDYLGGFSTNVTFDTNGCEIANNNLQPISSSYVDGYVEQSAAVGTVSMYDLTELIGNTVNMPVTIIGTGFGAVDAITLKVAYDETQLAYAGIVEDAITGATASAAGGVLTINWTGTAIDFTSLANLLNIQFVYYGGNAAVKFIPGCEISSALTLLATDYVDGSVEPIPQSSSLTIQSVGGTPNSSVSVPVVAHDILQTVGSIALNISYGDSLIYTGYTANQLSNWLVNGNVSGVITIAWSNTGGSTITDGDLITLNFNYTSSVTLIEFDPGCELKTTNLVTIPVTFNNGLVGAFTVSGVLKYANTAGAVRPLANSIVYLKSAGGAIIDQDNTDASGNYEFTGVVPGSYLLDASTTIAWGGVNIGDAIIIRNNAASFVPGTMLFYAADVNETNTVNIGDAIIIRNWTITFVKPAAWSAPEWIFQNPAITVVDSNVTQDVEGICSGDANASNIP